MFVKSLLNKWSRDEDGATAVVYAIALPVIVGMSALAVEVGHFQQRNARIQSSADMAAIATALEFQITNDRDAARLAGRGDALENGYIVDGGAIEVENPIVSGPFSGQEGAIVRIRQKQDRYLSGIIPGNKEYVHTVEATVLAVAGEGGPICALALNDSERSAISVSGNVSIELEGCGLHTNSSSDESVRVNGGPTIDAECISTVGESRVRDTNLDLECGTTPEENVAPIANPYGDVEVDEDLVSSLPCEDNIPRIQNRRTVTLGPAAPGGSRRFCRNVDVGGTLELEPGTYYFDNAELKFNGNGASLSATPPEGVTLVFLNGGEIGSGHVSIRAQSEGPFAGIALFGDPATSNASRIVQLGGQRQAFIEGAIVFPTQTVRYTGGSDLTSSCTQLIADKIEFNGNSGFNIEGCEPLGARGIEGPGSGQGVRLVN